MSKKPPSEKKKAKYPNTPAGQYKRWNAEFAAAGPAIKKWQKEGDKVVRQYLGKGDNSPDEGGVAEINYKLNLFHSNVTTLMSMLYGNTPKVEVDRSFGDSEDDVARVASEISSRILNQDIQDPGATCVSVLRQALEDRLLPGMGSARCKYDYKSKTVLTPAILDPETGEELAPEVEEEQVTDEWVDILYTHWKDIKWSPARTYEELRWKAYRSYLDEEALIKRFGEEVAEDIPMGAKGKFSPSDTDSKDGEEQANPQAEVWEIWSKTDKKVYWYVEGYSKILEVEDDPLELDQFWPDPPPMIANATTSKWMPRSDYAIAQDLYTQINELETRISMLTRACKLVGVYDKKQEGIKRVFNEAIENDLIPVDNWAAFAEAGGVKGVIDWIPIDMVAEVINQLSLKQESKIQQLYEVTGMSDILRGAAQKYEAAATSKAKDKFASIRVQALQDEFARFAGDLQAIKLEIMQKHFEPYCFLQQSNIENTVDAQFAQPAIELLKDPEAARWRVKVRPESLAMADYAQMKADRVEFITGLSTFMQSAAPLVQLDKKIVPTLLRLLQWGLAGFKGSNQIEGVMDEAIRIFTEQAKQPEQPKPDPQMEKIKAEMEMAREEHQAKMQQQEQKAMADMAEMQQKSNLEQEKIRAQIEQDKREFELRMAEMQQEFKLEMSKLIMELKATKAQQDIQVQGQAQSAAIGIQEKEHAAQVQMESADANARANKSIGGDE
jgi:hypothetical protein